MYSEYVGRIIPPGAAESCFGFPAQGIGSTNRRDVKLPKVAFRAARTATILDEGRAKIVVLRSTQWGTCMNLYQEWNP